MELLTEKLDILHVGVLNGIILKQFGEGLINWSNFPFKTLPVSKF